MCRIPSLLPFSLGILLQPYLVSKVFKHSIIDLNYSFNEFTLVWILYTWLVHLIYGNAQQIPYRLLGTWNIVWEKRVMLVLKMGCSTHESLLQWYWYKRLESVWLPSSKPPTKVGSPFMRDIWPEFSFLGSSEMQKQVLVRLFIFVILMASVEPISDAQSISLIKESRLIKKSSFHFKNIYFNDGTWKVSG